MPRPARRLARHAARAGTRERARPGRAGLRPRRVRQLRRQPARVLRRRPRAHPAPGAGARLRGAPWSSSATRTPTCSTPDRDPDDVARTPARGERTRHRAADPGARRAPPRSPPTGETSAEPRPIEVVDTVGAGDAFMAATLAQLSDLDAFRQPGSGPAAGRARTSTRLLRGAIEVAAITCERRGANPPRRRGASSRLARLTCWSRSAASTWSITIGSTAMPQWLVRTSTCSAAGSRQARQSTMPSRLL